MDGKEFEVFLTVLTAVGIVVALIAIWFAAKNDMEERKSYEEEERLRQEQAGETIFRDDEPEDDRGQQHTTPR